MSKVLGKRTGGCVSMSGGAEPKRQLIRKEGDSIKNHPQG
jgi:hypothetical protein